MKYRVEEYDRYVVCDTAREVADYISEYADEQLYSDMLDDCYGDVDICGYSYSASIALERVDPIAYRCGLSDWRSDVWSEVQDEADRMDVDDEMDMYGYTVLAYDDEEDEE